MSIGVLEQTHPVNFVALGKMLASSGQGERWETSLFCIFKETLLAGETPALPGRPNFPGLGCSVRTVRKP